MGSGHSPNNTKFLTASSVSDNAYANGPENLWKKMKQLIFLRK